MRSFLLGLLLLGGHYYHARAFAPPPSSLLFVRQQGRSTSTFSTSALFYLDDGRKEEKRNDENNSKSTDSKNDRDQKKSEGKAILTIPVFSPIPGNPPLVVGSDLELSPPTPMQWQSLEEAFHLHQQHLLLEGNNGENNNGDGEGVAGIEAAPLVAILDDATAGDLERPGGGGKRGGGRYATIAAVVGVSKNPGNGDGGGNILDPDNFMESVMRAGRDSLPTEGRVRLVGIGRAALRDFFYQVPSSVRNAVDDEGHLIMDERSTSSSKDDDDDGPEPVQDVVMAHFRLLVDGEERSEAFATSKGRSRHASPVHAASAMQSLAGKIRDLHEDRRKIVAGLKAAQLRLELRQQKLLEGQQPKVFDELFDHDGIGTLFAQRAVEATQTTIEKFLADFAPKEIAASESAAKVTRVSPLADRENWGMGVSASSVSAIPQLTSVWQEKLTPYYSPARCESEEHHFEVLSFVSVLALEKFLTPQDLSWSLKCTNTLERLEQCYEWMRSHVRLLREEAGYISRELLDCGEECTDLF